MRRHDFVLFDNCTSDDLGAFFGAAELTSVRCGLNQRADDFDVIYLASERRALLVSSDYGILEKCKQYQQQRRTCMWGLVVLPTGIEIQRRILEEINLARRKILHPHFDGPVTWKNVRYENLAVIAHIQGNPQVLDLCDCPWEHS